MRLLNRGMTVNEVLLDTELPWYTTLGVEGRETVPIDIETIKLSGIDGERFKSRRIDTKKLTVHYLLSCTDIVDMQEKYNVLKEYLYTPESQITFDDDPDVYWVGTMELQSPKYRGQDAATGKIIVYCSDPYKYAISETQVIPATTVEGTAATFLYRGTQPAFPIFRATATSNIGFIGISDAEGHVIQIGDPMEVDQEGTWEQEKSVVDITSTPPTNSTWTERDPNFALLGTRQKMGSVSTARETVKNKDAATPSYGSQSSGWHGPSLSYILSGDGSAQASLQWQQLFYDGTSKKTAIGLFQAQMNDASGNCIAGVMIYHAKSGSANSTIDLYINGAKKKTVTFKATQKNEFTGTKGGTCSMDKFGDTITYKIGTKTYTLRDSAIESTAVKECGFYFGRSGTKPVMTRNVLYKADILSHRVFSYQNVPNKIQSGDEIEVDVGSGTIYLNGVPAEGLGALGNDYETFKLTPGSNTIGFIGSDWAASQPNYTIAYREVFK